MNIPLEKLLNLADAQVLYDDLRARIPSDPLSCRINTTAYWDAQRSFVPRRGLMVIYTDHGRTEDGRDIPGIKIGDGNAYLVDLPFAGEEVALACIRQLEEHLADREIHVSAGEKARWNSKLNCEVSGTTLTLYKA